MEAPSEGKASSKDGKVFDFSVSNLIDLPLGSYVLIEPLDGSHENYVGQILSMRGESKNKESWTTGYRKTSLATIITNRGNGRILGTLLKDGFQPTRTPKAFAEANITKAKCEDVGALLDIDRNTGVDRRPRSNGPALPIGRSLFYPDDAVQVWLDASGFEQHSFVCGQSRSGKTFSLGILIEQLICNTDMRVVVLDPNSDFVNLGSPPRERDEVLEGIGQYYADDTYEMRAQSYDKAKGYVRVLCPIVDPGNPSVPAENRLRIVFSQLAFQEQAAILSLNRLVDREEYSALLAARDNLTAAATSAEASFTVRDLLKYLSETIATNTYPLRLRIHNLQIENWNVWLSAEPEPKERSLATILADSTWRCLVLDTGSLSSQDERDLVAATVLHRLWEHRREHRLSRQHTLVVLEEAHNVCPPKPSTALQELSTEYVARISGEGNKFGLHLLISTQRPTKIHENILTQCKNLMLLRMSSMQDVAYLATIFADVPIALLEQALTFAGHGQALIAGFDLVPSPTFAKCEIRLSREGGGQLPHVGPSPSPTEV